MALNFNKFAAEGENFIKELAHLLQSPEDTSKAGRVLISVLHALRNQLPPEESVQMLSQFPMFLKSVYVLNWDLHEKRKNINHFDQFIHEIRVIHGDISKRDFKNDEDVEEAIFAVFKLLRKYLSLGEIEDIRAVLPKELKAMLNSVLMI